MPIRGASFGVGLATQGRTAPSNRVRQLPGPFVGVVIGGAVVGYPGDVELIYMELGELTCAVTSQE